MPKQNIKDQYKSGAYQMKMYQKIQQGYIPTEEEIKEFAKLKGYTKEESRLVLDDIRFTRFRKKRTYKGKPISELKSKNRNKYDESERIRKKKLKEIQWRDEGSIGKNPNKKKNIIIRAFQGLGKGILGILDILFKL